MEQFHSPCGDPDAYRQEALRRDPGDIRVNTILGIDAIKGGRYADAERLLRKALERSTASYTLPKDGEAFYYLGLALKAQGKLDDAYAQFYKSTWSAVRRSPSYFELAEIASARGDFAAALTKDEDALQTNALDTAPGLENSIQSIATASQGGRAADAHFLVGLGQLGLNHRDQARQEFYLTLKASPDHYAAMRALTDMGP
jgi:tetratricopeptide (TPR) repeat protein